MKTQGQLNTVSLAIVGGALGLIALFFTVHLSTAATKTSAYTHTKDGYRFSYPSAWTVIKTSRGVTLKPPAAKIKSLKTQGAAYGATLAVYNNDSSLYTKDVKAALKKGWNPFMKAVKTLLEKKYRATATIKTMKKSGWSASVVTLKKKNGSVTTTRRFVIFSKDKKKAFVLAEQWTKKSASPFASDIAALIKSFALYTAPKSVSWSFDGSTWHADSSPPACANPLVIPSPVNVSAATSVLFPGQYRGGNYKAHGGLRFDNSAYNTITVTAPLDGRITDGSRYIESGTVQYLFDLFTDCGIRIRFDHLNTLSPALQAVADTFPDPVVDDTRTTKLPTPLSIKAGDVLATAIGTLTNPFFDFGVYDLRQSNTISADADWASTHANEKEMGWYGICWLDVLPSADSSTVWALPAGDQSAGAASDYCGAVPSYETYAPYAGTWSGSWSNTTFGSTGTMSGVLTVNDDGTAQLVLDVDGFVFGLVNPGQKTFSGTYDQDALTFTGTDDDVFGDLILTFNTGGTFTISGLQVPASNVDVLTASGTVTATALNANYTLDLGGVFYAAGTISMTKN